MKALIVILALIASTVANSRVFVEYEEPCDIPSGWEIADLFPPTTRIIQLTFALKQQNVDVLEKLLTSVSNPKSPNYGEYLTLEEVAELVSPDPNTIATVLDWLSEYGVKDFFIPVTADFLRIEVPLSTAEAMLDIKYRLFRHQTTGATVLRSLEPYSLPSHIAPLVDFVGGVSRFPRTTPRVITDSFQPAPFPYTQLYTPLSGNEPNVVYYQPGDGALGLFLLLVCADGTPAVDSCYDDPFQNFAVQFNENTQGGSSTVLQPSYTECQACADWSGNYLAKCNASNEQFGLSNDVIYCLIGVNGLPNFTPATVSVTTVFKGAMSDPFIISSPIVLSPYVTPAALRANYGIPSGLRGGVDVDNSNVTNSMAVAEFLGEYYAPSDLAEFLRLMGLLNQTVVKTVGPNNVADPGAEATLDIEYIVGVAPGVPVWFWSTAGLYNGQEPFLDWIVDLSNTPNAPWVHSISYDDQENSLSLSYVERLNIEFMKAGLRGLSLLFAAGDDGVGGYLERDNASVCATRFSPAFPSSSPWVTSVGGTQWAVATLPICTQQLGAIPIRCEGMGEVVSSVTTGSRITTGGGFSDVFDMPEYQADAVATYLALYPDSLPPESYFNRTGRAYPDISALAHNYLVVLAGEVVTVDGTSASTPVVAAMIALINDARIAAGKPPLGFLNFALYQLLADNPQVYVDVVLGNNACSADAANCCPYGFSAAPGWDPTTGVGVPAFEYLMDALFNM